MTDMPSHFAAIAADYNDLRTTDEAPIEYIRDALAHLPFPRVADLGCGAGRYDLAMLQAMPRVFLYCVDSSRAMIAAVRAMFSHEKTDGRALAIQSVAESFLARIRPPLDAVCCMNAIHHISFQDLLRWALPAVKPLGHLFIYTRTRSQNAASVWGRHFPGFATKETRLYETGEMEGWIAASEGWRLEEAKEFSFPRTASAERLVHQARSHHYSTFTLYPPDALEVAIREFEEALRREYPDPERIAWRDGNIMVHLVREG